MFLLFKALGRGSPRKPHSRVAVSPDVVKDRQLFHRLEAPHKRSACNCGLPWWLSGKESICCCRLLGFDPWVGKIPWRRKWPPTPVLLPGKSPGQRSRVGYSPWGHRVRHDLATKQAATIARVADAGVCDPTQRWMPSVHSLWRGRLSFLLLFFPLSLL